MSVQQGYAPTPIDWKQVDRVSEVGPVMDALQRGGIEQTALHNHLAHESPHVMYMHIGARGRPVALATVVRDALARTATPPAMPPPAMGAATVINFQPTGAATAAVAGDFEMIATEVNPVLRALRANGIGVTSLHSHMLAETPRLLFMHFWGEGDALALPP